MRKTQSSFKQLIVTFSIFVLVIACTPPLQKSKSSRVLRYRASTPTITALSNITPTLQPTDVPNHYDQNDSFGDGFVAQVLIKDTNNLSREDILTKLVTLLLEYYKTKSQNPDAAIKDYKDIRISKVIEDNNNYDGFFEIVSYVEFSIIHIGGLPGEGEIPINSGIHNDWVVLMTGSQSLDNLWWHIGSVFGYFRDGEYFRLGMMPGCGT